MDTFFRYVKVLREDGILLTWFTHSSFDQFESYEKEASKTFQADLFCGEP